MLTVATVAEFLEAFAPAELAEEWDNVGLLVGDPKRPVQRIMTCLTVTPDSADEAVAERADLIVTHHPLPFRPLRRLTTETNEGRLLVRLIAAGIAIYSPHTAFDSAGEGINQRLAQGLALVDTAPLVPTPSGLGAGRWGRTGEAISLAELATRVKQFLGLSAVRIAGQPEWPVTRVAVGCGSAGELLDAARALGCEAFVTGEARFHTCLEAEATGTGLVLAGHYASERFAVEQLAGVLAGHFRDVRVWASARERDPLQTL